MSSLNKACIIGNVGKAPEIRATQGGERVANFSVATSESWTDKNSGDKRERTEWHRITVWGKLAGIVERYVSKGTKVYLEGKIQTRKWQDQSGQDRYSTEIVLQGFDSKLVLLGGGRELAGDENELHPASAPGNGGGAGGLDDEIPFAPLRDLP